MSSSREKIVDLATSLGISLGDIEKCLSPFSSKELELVHQGLVETCILPTDEISLLPHQRAISKVLLEGQRGIIAAFPMGSGKTIASILTYQCLKRQASYFGKTVHAYIVTPTSLIDNYKTELIKAGYQLDPEDVLITKTKFFNLIKEDKLPDLSNYILIYDEIHSLRTDYRCEFCSLLALYHYSAKGGSQIDTMAGTALKVAQKAWRTIGLTGTPVYNKPYDWINLWSFATGEPPLTKEEYWALHYYPESIEDFPELNPSRVNPEIALHDVFAFFDPPREDFPRRVDLYHLVPMTKTYEAHYRGLEEKYISARRGKTPKEKMVESTEEGANSFMVKLRKGMNTIKDPEGNFLVSPKIDKAIEIIKAAKRGVIFYSEFLDGGVGLMKKKLTELKISWLVISGNVPQKKRGPIVEAYNSKTIKVLLITKAGGEGLNLKETSDIIIYESGWVESTEEQVIARGIRRGSHLSLRVEDREVKVHHLLLIFRGSQIPKQVAKILNLEKKGKVWVEARTKVGRENFGQEAFNQGADVYLKWFSDQKNEDNQKEIDFLKKYSLPI